MCPKEPILVIFYYLNTYDQDFPATSYQFKKKSFQDRLNMCFFGNVSTNFGKDCITYHVSEKIEQKKLYLE